MGVLFSYNVIQCVNVVYGHFFPKSKSYLAPYLDKRTKSVKQISGSERSNFLHLERNDHETK